MGWRLAVREDGEASDGSQLPTTTFPQGKDLGATWDLDLLKKIASLERYGRATTTRTRCSIAEV